MSFFTDWLAAWKLHNRELSRIADALERIAPLPESAAPALKPEEAVTYVDEQAMAEQEQADELGELERYMQAHADELTDANDMIPPRTI